ncbi:DUF1847 domain-containing protein [Methanosarcina sp. KYL-1]|uniref:DUF1847 domain-containing protein n=1 Tax=Methanosarcina sp. KYL-1 TaxID=2602068 RepID=UPI0021010B54|nr:DUF1847 domain-containing protein [Methanosarcina sp. KYL-1]MCQ1535045.1 DUF1847 domain-containing protein [Methanosarcina sp. KYL-1]
MKCALCNEKECRTGKDCTDIIEEISYRGKDLVSMKVSAEIEARYYMEKTRLEELVLYAQGMGYKKLGLAFCIGLEKEAGVIHRILARDFEVESVCCKVCGLSKDDFGLEKLYGDGFEATCNPIGQAKILNKKGTDLNIIVGLCIGHDILFTQNSKAPVTTLAVKDRVLAHNPLGAIYSGYYLKKRFGITD